MRNYTYSPPPRPVLIALSLALLTYAPALIGMEGSGMMIASRNGMGVEVGGGNLPHGFEEIPLLRITAYGSSSYIDTGVTVPDTGDFLMECDYWSKDSFTLYAVLGGANGATLTGQGFSVRGYPSWSEVWYYTATWNRNMDFKKAQFPAVVSGGVVGDKEYVSINGVVMTGDIDGTERGTNGSHTFTFGRSANPNDDFSGTILGRSRVKISGAVVWEGVPCVRTSDSAVGFFDIIGKSFCRANANFEAYSMPSDQ